MDSTPDLQADMLRETASAVRQAAADGERGYHPFSRTRFRVVPANGTPPAKPAGHNREGGR